MPTVTAGPQEIGKNCPCCQMPINAGENVEVCLACGVPHHQECWQRNRGCATFGCQQAGSAAPVYGSQPGYQPQPGQVPTGAPQYGMEAPKTNGLAIASLILGIVGCMSFGFTSLPALVLGIVALVQIRNNKAKLGGEGLAIAGIVLSGILVLFIPIFAAILFPVFSKARDAARPQAWQEACMSNQKQLGLAMMQYMQDYDEHYPFAANWNQALAPYIKDSSVLKCPLIRNDLPGYALNRSLASAQLRFVPSPASTAGIYESIPGVNLSGGPELLPVPGRHNDGNNIGFADGHVKWYRDGSYGLIGWMP